MSSEPKKHRRRSIRLKEYDYSQPGAYFVTICTQGRECLFGTVFEGEMRLTQLGNMVCMVWNELPQFYPGVTVDQFIVMPNHVHGIIMLVGAGPRACPDSARLPVRPVALGHPQGGAPTLSLPDVVHRFKSLTATRFRQAGLLPKRLWQRNYYEHIIRNEKELRLVREYIVNNPLQWALDRENPINKSGSGGNDDPWLF